MKDLVREIQDSGINVIGNYIFGLQEDTLETMKETLELFILDLEDGAVLFMLKAVVLMFQLKLFIILLLWEIPDRMQQF